MPDPLPKYARVDPTNPEAWGQCDRCGFWWNLNKLSFQQQWAGTRLYSTGDLVCPKCLDIPNEQFRTIILPPDPPPIINARPPNFGAANPQPEPANAILITEDGVQYLITEDASQYLVTEDQAPRLTTENGSEYLITEDGSGYLIT